MNVDTWSLRNLATQITSAPPSANVAKKLRDAADELDFIRKSNQLYVGAANQQTTRIVELEAENKALCARIETLEGIITELNEQLNNLEGDHS